MREHLLEVERTGPEHAHVDPTPGCVQCYELWG
jgi:hypothetical protein